jgi:DNA invertase Pin-like site-specific DNA recombinase
MSRPRRAIGYARVSSVEQAHGTSLQDQQNTISTYAKSRGLTVDRFFVEAESGIREKQERRTQMLALHRDVREGDIVLCAKLDRWSRDTEQTLKSVREILEKGASFYAIDDSCDPSTRDGKMMLTMRAMMADEEHARIRDRLVGTRQLLRDRGFYVEGLPPIGYVRPLARGQDRNVLSVDPNGAERVRQVFRLAIRGKSMSDIATELGMRKDSVNGILRTRLYTGAIENSRGEWVKGHHEPLIDAATFDKARDAVASRRLMGKARSAVSETSTWLLRDIARCGLCGAKMSAAYAGPVGSGRRHYYRCAAHCTTNYIRVGTVESEAGPLIVARLAELREDIARGPEPVSAPVVDYAAKRAKLAAKRERVLESFDDGDMTRDEKRVKVAKIDEAQRRLDAAEVADAKPSALASEEVRRDVLRSLDVLAKSWKRAAPDVRRAVVQDLATAAHVAPGAPLRFTWRTAEALAEDVRP